MILLYYFVMLAIALFAVGMVGVGMTRHFLVMLIALEVSISAAALLAAAFYSYIGGDVMLVLFMAWTIAAVEAMALVSFYRYLARFEVSMDVTRLSRIKDE